MTLLLYAVVAVLLAGGLAVAHRQSSGRRDPILHDGCIWCPSCRTTGSRTVPNDACPTCRGAGQIRLDANEYLNAPYVRGIDHPELNNW
ncbi:hypothetical protein ACQP2F_06325 [Actinoplanes sp. CA-030573]|uniref:hypothetical protein n=1 Tax=Actinoplanes sp. CA-030573 TaxID=3239898 RepID=UPI003D91EA00